MKEENKGSFLSFFMAALSYVGSKADYIYDQSLTLDTADHEDHTFCGIMFNITCKEGGKRWWGEGGG